MLRLLRDKNPHLEQVPRPLVALLALVLLARLKPQPLLELQVQPV